MPEGAAAGAGAGTAAEASTKLQSCEDPLVRPLVDEFWSVVVAGGETVGRDAYLAYHECLYRALHGDFDEARARAAAEEDWAHDAGGGAALDWPRFRDSLLQLVGSRPHFRTRT
eukprot:tig00021036_g17331.t1